MVIRLRRSTTGEWTGETLGRGRGVSRAPLRVDAFTLTSFAVQNVEVVAVGTVSAILTNPAGKATSILTTIALPVRVGETTDEDLRLDIGPMALDLFGLQVNLSRLVLDITVPASESPLLGSVAGLLDDPADLARVLNEILEVM